MSYGWEALSPTHSPSARFEYSIAYDHLRNKTVLFGGALNGSVSSLSAETWEWDGTDWTQITTAHSPTARYRQDMDMDPSSGKIILFGGWNGSIWTSETWRYDGSDWTQLTPTHAPTVSNSFMLTNMAYDVARNNLLLWQWQGTVGGANGKTWIWNGSDWIAQSPANTPPHRASRLAFDATRNLVVMAPGNFSGNSFLYSDVWLWDGSDWTQDTASLPGGAMTTFLQVSNAWKYSPYCKGCILFSDSNGSNKTWKYDASGWTDLAPSSPPLARETCAATDAGQGKYLIFGGLKNDNKTLYNDTNLFSCAPSFVPQIYRRL